MWPKIAHILVPMADEVGKYGNKNKKIKIKWEPGMDKASKQMKLLVATYTMTYYPNYDMPFKFTQMLLTIKWEPVLCKSTMVNRDQLLVIAESLIKANKITQQWKRNYWP